MADYVDRKKYKENIKSTRQKKYEDASLEHLKRIIKKRCQTIFVGAVAKMEDHFGELWGEELELDEEQMNAIQRKWFDKFLTVRELVFDQGNDQITKLVNDIDNFCVSWSKLHIEFITKEHKKND